LCDKEGGDWSVLGPAALLHDIERPNEDYLKKKYRHEELSAETAEKMGYNERVVNAIHRHSCGPKCPKPIELDDKLLWDADKLDAFGPAGLARWFVIMGKNGYSAEEAAKSYITTTEDLGITKCDFSSDDSILEAWFYTETAKNIAKPKLKYTREFIQRVLE
jgi:putative nucleotidyltransferase with HDIG domain